MGRILIADSGEVVTETVSFALLAAGHAVGVLSNGKDALRVIRARKPELVILECNMPQLNGIIVLRELRNSEETFDLPVIMLTERSSIKDRDLIYNAGADDYLSKPFDADELVACVESLLKKATLTRHFALAPRFHGDLVHA